MTSPLRRLLSLFRPATPRVRLVVLGVHAPDWSAALDPGAPVWARLPEIGKVLLAPEPEALPEPDPRWRTMVLPLMERHLLACPRGAHAGLVPSAKAIATLADKAAFARHLAAHGLARFTPRTYAGPETAHFPCVMKRLDLNGGVGVAIVADAAELEARRQEWPWQGEPVLLQAYEPGRVHAVTHALCRGGRIVWHASYRNELPEGEAICRWDTPLIRAPMPTPAATLKVMGKVLATLDYDGPCCANYLTRTDGSPCLFEINPRLGGSLMRPENDAVLAAALRALLRHARPLAESAR